MRFRELSCAQDVIALVEEIGFLPFFKCPVGGFSVEELCTPKLWFDNEVEGPWEWKGPIARSGACVYGKFFGGHPGFVSCEWLPDFANFRRDGYDFDARFDDGLASIKDKGVYDALTEHGSLLSKELKRQCGYRKGGLKGFDTVIARLQMQTYVVVSNFEYEIDKHGVPYGWGVTRYSTPEKLFGYERVTSAYERAPEESRHRIAQHLSQLLPDADERQIAALVG